MSGENKKNNISQYSQMGFPLQSCPRCEEIMSALPGTRDAVCKNCGYKDPCCE